MAWVTLKPGPSSAATFTNRALFVGILGATALFAVHLGAIVSLPLRSASPSYDFRLYSLLLLGVVGLLPAVFGLFTLQRGSINVMNAANGIKQPGICGSTFTEFMIKKSDLDAVFAKRAFMRSSTTSFTAAFIQERGLLNVKAVIGNSKAERN